MKRTVAFVCALVMALSVLPALSFAKSAPANPSDFPEHDPVNFYVQGTDLTAVTSVEDGGNGLGTSGDNGTRFIYLGLSENSGMFGGHGLIEYDPEFISVTAESTTFNTGINKAIEQTIEDEEQFSDIPASVSNMNYAGQTGQGDAVIGAAGHTYINWGMYLTSFDFGGLQMGGLLHRWTVKLMKTPYKSQCKQDANGYYLELPFTLTEFSYMLPGAGVNASENCVAAVDIENGLYEQAEWITLTNGKIYVNAKDDPDQPGGDHDPVNFYVQGTDLRGVTSVEDGGNGLGTSGNNGTRFIYLGLSENSGMFGGHGLIEYYPEFISVYQESTTFDTGIIKAIEQTIEDEEQFSDIPASVSNMNYAGQTGQGDAVIGAAGHTYINWGMYLTSFDFGGLQMGGLLHRWTVRLLKLPTAAEALYDEQVGAYYLPLPFTLTEFSYMLPGEGVNASENCVEAIDISNGLYQPAEWITLTDGRIYVDIKQDVETYTVTYNVNDEFYAEQTYEAGQTIVPPTYDVPEGYTFSGWDVPATMPAENIVVNATLTPITYTVEVYLNGELYDTVTYGYGEQPVLPDYTAPEGYTFSGWELGEDGNYYGTTTPITYTVNVYLNGELYATVTYGYGEQPVLPDYTAPEGYTFSGWELGEDGNYYGTTTPINYTITILYLKYSEALEDWVALQNPAYVTVPYGAIYDVNDQIPAMIGEYALVEIIGETTGNVTGNITIEAHYAIPVVPTYTVTYTINDEFFAEQTYEAGETIVPPAYTAPEGYTFSGWDVPATMPAENIVVNATLTLNTHLVKITYQYADGTFINYAEYEVAYGESYSYASPAIEGYTAYPAVVEGVMGDEDVEVVVNYTQVPVYTVTINFVDKVYYENGQIVYVTDSIVVEQPAGTTYTFTYPTVDGYTFEHQGEEEIITISGPAELTYKYDPNAYPLTIHYVYNNENGPEAAPDYTEDVLYLRPYSVESPVIEGYTASILVVNGEMAIGGEIITVVYTANNYPIVIHYVDDQGNELYPDYTAEVAYGADYSVVSPTTIPYWYPDIEIVEGTMGVEGVEVTVHYTYDEPYQPVPPTVEATKAEIRTRATEDELKDLRFIFTVNFNDSFIVYKNNTYGKTGYYEITRYWSVMSTGAATVTVNGTTIWTMYEDADGEANNNVFTYSAVVKGIKPANFDATITVVPHLTYTMGGVNGEYVGQPFEASVNSASN